MIKVGLIGCGTVGSGVVEYFKKNKHPDIKIEGIVVENKNKKREVDFNDISDNINDILNNRDIEIVVEVMGGYKPARTYILGAIEKKKHVVTANKAVISRYGKEIFGKAKKNKVNVGFEGAVAGGIPIIRNIKEYYKKDNVSEFIGIINGTTNFILTKMSKEGLDYEQALKIAQENGFAEANPSFDVEGTDAKQKLSILVSLLYHSYVNPENIYCEGITKITNQDINFAKEIGYEIKLLTIAKNRKEGLELRVHPALVSSQHHLSTVSDENNAIYTKSEFLGEQLIVGKGAGKNPTGFAVANDIIDIAKKIKENSFECIDIGGKKKLIPIGDVKAKGYIRINLKDAPGSLAKVCNVLAKNDINVKNVIQREKLRSYIDGVLYIPAIITTDPIKNKIMFNALEKIENIDCVHEKPFYLRIEE